MTQLSQLSEQDRTLALDRFYKIRPFLQGASTLKAIAEEQQIPYRTLQRWVRRYRQDGLVGLARKRRHDAGQRKLPSDLQQFIEGLALQKERLSAAAIYRRIKQTAPQHGWNVPSYNTIYDVVRSLNSALVTLAHEGSKAYQQNYDLLYRREAKRPNEIWQADHCLLDIWLLDVKGKAARPWLTVIQDDYSRCIAGYFLSFNHPNTQNTSLALRQAIWRKSESNWRICGIPEIFYTDNGADFTSHHMEQVSADLKMQLVFSIPGMPRGRGRVERFFQTVNQLFLYQFPGYAIDGKPVKPPSLILSKFDALFKSFLLEEYHQRVQKKKTLSPQQRWEMNNFLPQLPDSLEQLDLLLLTVAKTRKVRRDGIHFQSLRYMDLLLADYVGEEVVIRYDPRDMAEIRIFYNNRFLCRAVCQELANQIITLQQIIQARNRRRRELKGTIKKRSELIQLYLNAHDELPTVVKTADKPEEKPRPSKRLKRYYND